jgi:hypothetical protein
MLGTQPTASWNVRMRRYEQPALRDHVERLMAVPAVSVKDTYDFDYMMYAYQCL